jgi:hypothetical protein
MMLRREVPRFRQQIRWPLVGAVSAIVMMATTGLVLAPRLICMDGKSRQDSARMTVDKLAVEMFPAWRAMHSRQSCPQSIADLRFDTIDPWGTRYRMQCGPHRFVAISAGEDKTFGTADDIRSDR